MSTPTTWVPSPKLVAPLVVAPIAVVLEAVVPAVVVLGAWEAPTSSTNTRTSGSPTVLSLGGGAFTRPENVDLLTENGVTVWIDATFPIVKSRVSQCEHRPLAKDPVRFEELYRSRREFYSKAEFRVEVKEDNSRKALAELLKLPLFD